MSNPTDPLGELDTITAQVARRLPRNADAQIVKGKVKLTDLLPESDLPGLLMEVDRWTGFTRTLT